MNFQFTNKRLIRIFYCKAKRETEKRNFKQNGRKGDQKKAKIVQGGTFKEDLVLELYIRYRKRELSL